MVSRPRKKKTEIEILFFSLNLTKMDIFFLDRFIISRIRGIVFLKNYSIKDRFPTYFFILFAKSSFSSPE